jgi:predicted metal-binding membrane protein
MATPVALRSLGVDRVLLPVVAALAWVLAWLSTSAGGMAGGMADSSGAVLFLLAWAPMVAAMMLPSVIPTARIWLRSMIPPGGAPRLLHLTAFTLGYLLVWTATGLPAYGLAVLEDRLAMVGAVQVHALQAGILLTAGAYQLSPLKRICLRHCRTPVADVLHYASWSPRLRNLRVGLAHGAYCTGCCWGLMAVMAVVAAMDLRLAAAMTVVVLLEKRWRFGERFALALGAGLVALAPVMFLGVLTPSM